MRPSFADIIASKTLSAEERQKDLDALRRFAATENKRCFAGNKFLYHHQIANLCRASSSGHKSLYDIINGPDYDTLWKATEKLNRTGSIATRVFEAWRFNGCVAMFKATTAKFLYQKYGAKKVLDPTAGWGGRMLGAWALGIDYTGLDTNERMAPAYAAMIGDLPETGGKLTMLFQSCLETDFASIDYDFVLTSPPYINLERYEGSEPFASKAAFYKEFLIPLLNKCLAHIKPGGRVCFNISPPMYKDLLKHGFRACDEMEDLLQQKRLNADKGDKVYIWKQN
jgi:hypothetical protein